ncbi:hypothetical protein M153_7710003546 [Pseudoloma neurophilia]|uniref:Uncharacterized protein n=1 Tax=Pseudoloma neurophilia TaxID=146866 RepID=A0A0R0LWJ7_9MICR|nr:hypothetical protein M153_7710003546 [Pseudoloma neurophilia]
MIILSLLFHSFYSYLVFDRKKMVLRFKNDCFESFVAFFLFLFII